MIRVLIHIGTGEIVRHELANDKLSESRRNRGREKADEESSGEEPAHTMGGEIGGRGTNEDFYIMTRP